MLELFLVVQRGFFSLEALIWVIGIGLLLGFVMLFFYQRKVGKGLEQELAQLGKVRKHNEEHELVLKAMKLCTWHIDAVERTITYDNDFRDRQDCFVPTPGGPRSPMPWLMLTVSTSVRRLMSSVTG